MLMQNYPILLRKWKQRAENTVCNERDFNLSIVSYTVHVYRELVI